MPTRTVQAVAHRNGRELELLEPVEIAEGEQIRVVLYLPERRVVKPARRPLAAWDLGVIDHPLTRDQIYEDAV